MPAQSSATPSGGRCIRLRHWCRALEWDWICCVPAAATAIPIRRWNAKKSCLSSAVRSCFFAEEPKTTRLRMVLADPAAAHHAVAIVKDCALTRSDGALRRVEGHAGTGRVQQRDGGIRGDVLVADFYRRAQRFVRGLVRDPVYVLHFARRAAQRLVVSDHHAIVLAIDGKHIQRLAGGKPHALALPDRACVHSVVPADTRPFFCDHLTAVMR